VELVPRESSWLVGSCIAGISSYPGPFARDADVEEGLAEIVAPTRVSDQAVRCSVPGVNVSVDETRGDELAARIDLAVAGPVEPMSHI
jgi:hypothetical protein